VKTARPHHNRPASNPLQDESANNTGSIFVPFDSSLDLGRHALLLGILGVESNRGQKEGVEEENKKTKQK